MKLPEAFYRRSDVVKIARELIGKQLFTKVKGVITGGTIVETEAYSWKERGCHAFGGRMTERNKIMFAKGGHTYVYLCYGMHHLFNVVTNDEGIADAVLIRAIEPGVGMHEMAHRRGNLRSEIHLTSGPGKLTKALGIDRTFNGKFLLNDEVWIEDGDDVISRDRIVCSKRIGIDYAGEDAALPWRFSLKESKWVSK
jgi:DNA-3-methyladenine glycosylase